jgi:hemoglobin
VAYLKDAGVCPGIAAAARASLSPQREMIMMDPTIVRRALLCALVLVPAGNHPALAQADGERATLYERLGGLPAISLVISDFVDDFVADPLIMANPAVRERKTPDATPYIKYQVTTLLCEVTGGPCRYTGLGLREAHADLNVSPAEWDRMVEIFSATLDQHRLPPALQQEVFAILGPTRDDIVVGDR